MKRAFIVHCWGGNPDFTWYKTVAQTLEASGFSVSIPQMPDTHNPRIGAWVEHLQNIVGTVDEETFFIGHSVGCQTIMRFLASQNNVCGGVLLVAGWFNLVNVEPEGVPIIQPWIDTPIDTKRVSAHAKKILALFSDDDPWVPLSDAELFKQRLHAKTYVEHKREHFDEKENGAPVLRLVKGLVGQ